MADGAGIGEPESSEADSVSLTSTTESDGEGKEYAVDRILAEWETDGETSYLTKWDGYPEEQSTWQLRETFNPEEAGGQDVFKEWQERKMRISRGYEKPYDIDDWERRNKKLEEEVLDRRDRRRRRKAKLNHMLDALDSDPEASTDKTSSEDKSKPKARSTSQSSFEGNGTRPGNQNKFGFSLKQTPWTNAQKQVFMRGLQDANGPYWIQIFAWYGRLGTINQILRDKTLNDLQTQLQLMRQEFVDAGRDPPEYMTALKSQTEVEGAMEAKSRTRRGRKAASVGESDSSDEHTSTDSMMEEIKAKKISHSAKAMKTIELAGSRRIRKASGVADSPQILGKSARPKPIKKESSDPKSVSEIPFESTKSKPPRKESIGKAIAPPSKESNVTRHNYMSGASPLESTNRLLPRPVTMKKPYAGTARTPANKSSEGVRIPNKARVGVPQSGPARFPVPSSRPRTNKAIPKAKASGIDVLANWNGEPKIRKARTLPTINTDASANQPLRTFKTLSTRNNVQKWRRNEPAPDPSQVVFLDPRTGKAPKTLPKSSLVNAGTTSLFESPFERYQRELAAKAAEKPDLNENEETLFHNDDDRMSVDDDEPSPARRDLDTGGDLQSNSDLVRVNSEPDPPIPSYPSANTFPSMAPPTGARAPFAHFSQPHNQWPVSKSPPSSMHTWLPTESSPLSLRGYPSYYEKLELFNTLEQILVLGNIKIGPRLEDVGKMKLAGFDWDVKRLLLTIKDPIDPMRMDFEFTNICTAANYARYWHNVRMPNLQLITFQLID